MRHCATVLADSISLTGHRLTSLEVTYPRIIHAEMLRHRVHSRCVASSRAIPTARFIKQVEENPYIPIHWGQNQKGMQAEQELTMVEQNEAAYQWLKARDEAVARARELHAVGLHKQITNRLLEPWMWVTEVLSGTEWSNFFHLRVHPAAHPEIQCIASLIQGEMSRSTPKLLTPEEWHTPYIRDEESFCPEHREGLSASDMEHVNHAALKDKVSVSVGRCARVSYLTHEGKRDTSADVGLHDRLVSVGHLSPTEHVARPMTRDELNLYGRAWIHFAEPGRIALPTPHGPLEHGSTVCVDDGNMNVVSTVPGQRLLGGTVSKVTWDAFCGNYDGWVQYRKTIKNEEDFLGVGV